jgi:hypothetical protein
MLKKIVWPKREKVAEDWRRLYNEELYGLYCSPSVIRVIKSRRTRGAGYTARIV